MGGGHRERIERAAGVPGLVPALDRLAPTDLQSLLLEVYRRRAERLSPAEVARRYATSRFLHPSVVDAARLRSLDDRAFALAAAFAPIELSPVAPLGVCSVLGSLSQDVAVSTSRNNEVCSDPTNVLALECARRRRARLAADARSRERVRLCTSHRVVRAQNFDAPGAWSHFRLFALCTAGRGEPSHGFETESLVEQAALHVELVASTRDADEWPDLLFRLTCLDERCRPALAERVLEPLRERFAGLRGGLDAAFDDDRASGRGYYETACFQVNARDRDGEVAFLADGGFTAWARELLGDRRERLLVSGFGSERWCHLAARRT